MDEPPAVLNMLDDDMEKLSKNKLKLTHPCRIQTEECHGKLVSEVSIRVEGFERRDGMIRQRIKSRILMLYNNTKK